MTHAYPFVGCLHQLPARCRAEARQMTGFEFLGIAYVEQEQREPPRFMPPCLDRIPADRANPRSFRQRPGAALRCRARRRREFWKPLAGPAIELQSGERPADSAVAQGENR